MTHNIKEEVAVKIVQEAWENPSFKQHLIDSPIEAIKALTGVEIELPVGVKSFRIIDQTNPNVININIPTQPEMDMKLSESELELVSGGVLEQDLLKSEIPNPFKNFNEDF
jgi:hypothetical protein